MRSYKTNPAYHPDDKDLYDFLQSARPSFDALQEFLAPRGIYISPFASQETMYSYVASLPLNWSQCETLLDLQSLRRRSDLTTESEVHGAVTLGEVEAAFRKVRELRALRNKETYTITRVNDDELIVNVNYVDINYKNTRLFQQIEDEVTFEIRTLEDGIAITRRDDERASAIEENFIGILEEDQKERRKELQFEQIDLSKIKTSEARNKFFWSLQSGVEGYEFDKLTGAKVRMYGADLETDIDDSQSVAMANCIKRAQVSGDNILNDEKYQNFLGQGFYIIAAEWVVQSVTNSLDKVHYKLAFRESRGKWIACFRVSGVSDALEGITQPRCRPTIEREKKLLDLIKARTAEVFVKFST